LTAGLATNRASDKTDTNFKIGEEIQIGSFSPNGAFDYEQISVNAFNESTGDFAETEFRVSIRLAHTDEEIDYGYCNYGKPLDFTVSGYNDIDIYATAIAGVEGAASFSVERIASNAPVAEQEDFGIPVADPQDSAVHVLVYEHTGFSVGFNPYTASTVFEGFTPMPSMMGGLP
jgi:hypothetical protein